MADLGFIDFSPCESAPSPLRFKASSSPHMRFVLLLPYVFCSLYWQLDKARFLQRYLIASIIIHYTIQVVPLPIFEASNSTGCTVVVHHLITGLILMTGPVRRVTRTISDHPMSQCTSDQSADQGRSSDTTCPAPENFDRRCFLISRCDGHSASVVRGSTAEERVGCCVSTVQM